MAKNKPNQQLNNYSCLFSKNILDKIKNEGIRFNITSCYGSIFIIKIKFSEKATIISNHQNRQEIFFSNLVVFSQCSHFVQIIILQKVMLQSVTFVVLHTYFFFKSYQNFIKDSCLIQNLKSLFSKKSKRWQDEGFFKRQKTALSFLVKGALGSLYTVTTREGAPPRLNSGDSLIVQINLGSSNWGVRNLRFI